MENVTISVLNECWKSIVFARHREDDGQEVQRIRNPPFCRGKERVWGGEARRRQTEMRMVPAQNTEGLIMYGLALFLSF